MLTISTIVFFLFWSFIRGNHFWPIFPYKTPKSKTFVAIGHYVSKNSENWYLGSSYTETIGFRRPAHKKGFFIFRNTLMDNDKDWRVGKLTNKVEASFQIFLGAICILFLIPYFNKKCEMKCPK